EEAITWFDLTMGSRGLGLDAATIAIMQRLHEGDLSGHIIETLGDRFTHICLPMHYEPGRQKVTVLGWSDPRTEPGELLWPGFMTPERVERLEAQLRAKHGEFGIAGQLQQRPIPQGGGMFKREWFPIVDALPADARVVARCRAWDCAATEGAGDWTSGVRMSLTSDGIVYVEDVVRGQWGPNVFEGDAGIFMQTVRADGAACRQREEMEPGSAGKKVVASHAKLLMGYDYRGEPSTGDKQTRARPFAAQAATGNVRLIRGPWNAQYIAELCAFPNANNDDQVDSSGTAFNEIALGGSKQASTMKVTGY
ncbi:MAG TPA: phage terminase large subunit, partial [Anaeromyxobacteraceae bacterium]|nr:phage terminase large subunit [Anaeromyxobacteraceae bacterium]